MNFLNTLGVFCDIKSVLRPAILDILQEEDILIQTWCSESPICIFQSVKLELQHGDEKGHLTVLVQC